MYQRSSSCSCGARANLIVASASRSGCPGRFKARRISCFPLPAAFWRICSVVRSGMSATPSGGGEGSIWTAEIVHRVAVVRKITAWDITAWESTRMPPFSVTPINPATTGRDLSGQHSAASAKALGQTPPTPSPTRTRRLSLLLRFFQLLEQAVVVGQAGLDGVLEFVQVAAVAFRGAEQRVQPRVHHLELVLEPPFTCRAPPANIQRVDRKRDRKPPESVLFSRKKFLTFLPPLSSRFSSTVSTLSGFWRC